MSYYIDIIDTLSPLTQIVIKSASAKGIVLEWSGSDAKDDKSIVGSNLLFDMLTDNDDDAAFIDFFTGDEHRFKTLVKDSADDSIIWQGYILPDLYSEPYKQVNFFVSFTASDGLGRLKGKYLPAEYYTCEKSLIDIFCQILRLSGLELEMYFSPAIENFKQKDWNKIYIDTESFVDGKKQKDAYKIFETLLADTLCVCYQCDNRWYIEGINIRQMRKVTYKNYDSIGNLLGTVVFDRVLKQITPLVTPMVTMIPPYNEVIVTHKKTAPTIPKTASKESNDGWVMTTGGRNGVVDPSEWMAHGDYLPKAISPDYNVTIFNQYWFDQDNNTVWPQDDTKYISLRKKLFFTKNEKVKFTLDFQIKNRSWGTNGDVSTWNNVFKYQIVSNGDVLYSNDYNNSDDVIEDCENLFFNDSGNCKIQIEHIFQVDGLVDIRLFRPTGRVDDNGVLGVVLNEIQVETINFVEQITETDLINGDFTIDKEIYLTYAEDKSGFSDGFRLAKLKEETNFYNDKYIYIYYGFSREGKNYSVVLVEGANLIKENKFQVYYNGSLITVVDVIYNFINGEQMVIETLEPYNSGYFYIKKYATDDVVEDRNNWTQWTDAFYKIENKSYIKTIANIYRRMFNEAHEKLDLTALNAVKFNDMIQFHYVFMKDFVVLNCTWNLDSNKAALVVGRVNYRDSVGVGAVNNIPPIVVAGDDVYINDGVADVTLLASAYDPDGFIASQVWTKISGNDGVINDANQLGISVSNLTGDYYTYQIQVTDNKGATAVDVVNIIRSKNYTIDLELVNQINYGEPFVDSTKRGYNTQKDVYKLKITPELSPDAVISFSGQFYIYARSAYEDKAVVYRFIKSLASYEIVKNGAFLEGNTVESTATGDSNIRKNEIPFSFNYMPGDEILIGLTAVRGPSNLKSKSGLFKAKSNIEIKTVKMSFGIGNILGVPLKKELKIVDLINGYVDGNYVLREIPD